MKISYDKKIDAMYIYLTSKRRSIIETKELDDGWIADYAGDELVGLEILDASKVLGSKLGFKTPTRSVSFAHKIKV